MIEENHVRLEDLPCSVRGFCYHDNDGEVYIVLNSRLTREQNQRTFDHEMEHILREEMYIHSFHEYEAV